MFIFYKVCKSLSPPPVSVPADLARYPVRLFPVMVYPVSLAQLPVVILYPVSLDAIKKRGYFSPALIRCLYFLSVWKAENTDIFRPDCLGDLFQVCRV